MPFTLPNTESSITNPATQPWKTDNSPLDWLLNLLFPSDPQSAIQGIMGAGVGLPKPSGMERAAQASLKAMKAKAAKQELDPLAQLIMDAFKGGKTLSRNDFLPTLKYKGNVISTGEAGGYHGDLWGRLAAKDPQSFMAMQNPAAATEHAFQTTKGLDVPYDVGALLTGNFDKLKQAADLVSKGIPIDDIISLFQATGPVR